METENRAAGHTERTLQTAQAAQVAEADEALVARLADSLARAAAQDGMEGVILTAYLRHLYGGPEPEDSHGVGHRHLGALNAALLARGLPPVSYDDHCFRFLT